MMIEGKGQIQQDSPNQKTIITNLRDVLSSLYDNESSARRVAEDAGLNIRTISFGSSASNMWHSIINEATKQGHLISLVDMVSTGEYKDNPMLKGACESYYHHETQSRTKSDGKTSSFELRIDRDIDELTCLEQEYLLVAITYLLKTGGEVKLVSMRSGSVLARIELPKDDVRRLILLIKAGRLNNLKVTKFNLAGAHLSNTDLSLVGLNDIDLTEADLRGASLVGAHLSKANLEEANLEDANLAGANLAGASLVLAHLAGAHLAETNLAGANLWVADLRLANLTGANLWKANLRRANLAGANLAGANLVEANLANARYNQLTQWPDGFDYRNSGAIGPNAILTGTNLWLANLPGADLTGANLVKANLAQANLTRATLTGADLTRATLTGADLRLANLTGANLWKANIKSAKLAGANLAGANLVEANLADARYNQLTQWPDGFDYRNSGAIGPNAILTGTNLRSFTLTGADLTGADLTGADLTGANLTGANLTRANLTRANLADARYDQQTQWPDGFDYRNSGAIGPNANLEQAAKQGEVQPALIDEGDDV